jgi:hypothetical protein
MADAAPVDGSAALSADLVGRMGAGSVGRYFGGDGMDTGLEGVYTGLEGMDTDSEGTRTSTTY